MDRYSPRTGASARVPHPQFPAHNIDDGFAEFERVGEALERREAVAHGGFEDRVECALGGFIEFGASRELEALAGGGGQLCSPRYVVAKERVADGVQLHAERPRHTRHQARARGAQKSAQGVIPLGGEVFDGADAARSDLYDTRVDQGVKSPQFGGFIGQRVLGGITPRLHPGIALGKYMTERLHRRARLGDLAAADLQIHGRVEQDSRGWLSIAARAADLLIVLLHRLGNQVVDHTAHVGDVDSHAKGTGGKDDARGAALEFRRHAALVPLVAVGVE